MQCPNCETQYNKDRNLPRILIVCGHSVCEKCIHKLFSDNSIVCPECYTVNEADSAQSFPKNLALLHVRPIDEQVAVKMAESPDAETLVICKTHQKKIEAFCESDKSVLCIDCILSEDHKNHSISSTIKVHSHIISRLLKMGKHF